MVQNPSRKANRDPITYLKWIADHLPWKYVGT